MGASIGPSRALPDRAARPARACPPVVPGAIAFAAGIALDRAANLPWTTWLGLTAALLVVGALCEALRLGRTALVVWLSGAACLGGAHHHAFWSVRPPQHVSTVVGEDSVPVRIVGRIAEAPWIRPRREERIPGPVPEYDRSIGTFDCTRIVTRSGTVPVSGRTGLMVTGHLPPIAAGDEIEVRGWLRRPRGAGNPGEFDFRDHLRSQGIDCYVSVEYPQGVVRLAEGTAPFRRTLQRFRDEATFRLFRALPAREAGVAVALLLGSRTGMDDDLRDAFVESGTMHMLAISGQHVGILAALLWLACRWTFLSDRWTSAVVAGGVVAYACVTDVRGSIVRAAVVVLVAVGGRLMHRRVSGSNALAVSGLVVLGLNPSDLFDVGAQLSFLAVAGIVWSASWTWMLGLSPDEAEAATDPGSANAADSAMPTESAPLTPEEIARRARPVSRWRVRAAGLFRAVRSGLAMTAAVWLFALPLMLIRFHVVSPVGFLANVVLTPLMVVVLWAGYGLLTVGWLLPWTSPAFAAVFGGGLRLLLDAVDRAATLDLSHVYLAGPGTAWVVGWYVLLVGLVVVRRVPRRAFRAGILLAAWSVLGLALGLRPAATGELRGTVVSVGHGLAVLLELPGGRVLLYDVGSFEGGSTAAKAVEGVLWSRGRSRIDAVVISHADSDHFDGLATLARHVPIGEVLTGRALFRRDQPAVRRLAEVLREEGLPPRVVWAGDKLLLDPEVRIEVLAPRAGEVFDRDNDNSLTIEVEYAGRRVLLTGDLEPVGLARLFAQEPRRTDVLLAPHHGSPKCNTRMLADWARPTHVVASVGRLPGLDKLVETYAGSDVHVTQETGAVTFVVARDGTLTVTRHRPPASMPPLVRSSTGIPARDASSSTRDSRPAQGE